jgi:hypothetical protein
LIIGSLLDAIASFAAGTFAYSYVFLADIVATEQVNDPAGRQVVAR